MSRHSIQILPVVACVLSLFPPLHAEETSLPAQVLTSRGWMSTEEAYLPGVVHAELASLPPSRFGVDEARLAEARKAVAVSARSRLLAHLLENGRTAEVPLGASFQPWGAGASAAELAAIRATAGEVLTHEGRAVAAARAVGAWPRDAAGRAYSPGAYGYVDRQGRTFANWDEMRRAYASDPQGYRAFFLQSRDPWSWTELFVTANEGRRGTAVAQTLQIPAGPRNRGSMGLHEACLLAARGAPSREPRSKLDVLSGKWTYLWRLEQIYNGDVDRTVQELRAAKVAGVAVKIHNGTYAGDWDTPAMARFLELCNKAGIRIAFWGYIYLRYDPAGEARLAGKMVRKYAPLVDFYLIDAEAEAKNEHGNAKIFAAELAKEVGPLCPIGLASYRYPSLHRELPWKELRAICQFDSPQVYYRNGDPIANLTRSKAEFQAMQPRLPYFPAGDMYLEHGTKPTPEAVTRYLQACKDDPDIHGTLMWVADHMQRVPELWRAFAEFDWPAGNAPSGPDYRELLRRFHGADALVVRPSAPPPVPVPAPGAPATVSPADGAVATGASVTLSWRGPSATEHRVSVEWEGSNGFQPYYTWSLAGGRNSFTFWPQFDGRTYRWRVQSRTAAGWTAWSAYSSFRYRRSSSPAPAPAPGGLAAPSGLSPSGGRTVRGTAVALSWSAVSGATSYEVEIDYFWSGSFRRYYTYSTTAPSKTFWPTFRSTPYRFRVRAKNAAGSGPWSGHAEFRFEP
ncbi:MAG: hypothetical protein HY720_22945 [Planctomycetes bacterium]|nr:hypothetical protein [Planctomycetota bacterium]